VVRRINERLFELSRWRRRRIALRTELFQLLDRLALIRLIPRISATDLQRREVGNERRGLHDVVRLPQQYAVGAGVGERFRKCGIRAIVGVEGSWSVT
jgi:hypothetical protein